MEILLIEKIWERTKHYLRIKFAREINCTLLDELTTEFHNSAGPEVCEW